MSDLGCVNKCWISVLLSLAWSEDTWLWEFIKKMMMMSIFLGWIQWWNMPHYLLYLADKIKHHPLHNRALQLFSSHIVCHAKTFSLFSRLLSCSKPSDLAMAIASQDWEMLLSFLHYHVISQQHKGLTGSWWRQWWATFAFVILELD